MNKYTNRHGDIFTFTIDENNDILWEGDFQYHRVSYEKNNDIFMVDPSGGPYITKGMDLNDFVGGEFIVNDFQVIKNGYKIITEKIL